ncbi:phosphate acyltransferase [Bacilli bacterium]|nr:phosphate acyltransferase [Bacilli bacterium]
MKLAIDVMGFENDPNEAINACRLFNKKHSNVNFILVGQKTLIESHLKTTDKFEIVNATDIIKMNTSPVAALRSVNSSMYKAIELVQKGTADGVLSAGSSTCFVPMTYVLLKVIPGINKPAFMPFVPTTNRRGFMFLDTGANKECTGEDLHQFALLATVYCQLVRGIQKPNVGIINIGTEAEKGFSYHKEANELCQKDLNISYRGFVEPRSLLDGLIDIAVADGYTGNIVLKSLEGGLSAIKSALKKEYAKPYN